MALDDLLKRMSDGTNLRSEFQVIGNVQAVPAEWEEPLLRIAQESITNTAKHANAMNLKVTLSTSSNEVQLQLVDDGGGFDVQAGNDGFGLIGMRERVDRLGGRFIIRSKPGEGTEVLVILSNPPVSQLGNGNE